MSYAIPEDLNSDRLFLRKPIEADWEPLTHYYSDKECMKYTTGRALAEWEVWRSVATIIGHWEMRGYGPYVLVEKKSQQVIGLTGPWYPLEWPSPEIMWGLVRSAWGKGFAREAAEAVLVMAATHIPDIHLISMILPDNANSIRLAKALGATYENTIPFRDTEACVYRHKKSLIS
jgi:RimJ/RimL family protein N-acetyltransferase